MSEHNMSTFREVDFKYTLEIAHPELDLRWECECFGCGRGIVITPRRDQVPNFFWRWMQWICFGNKWIKKDVT